jgi:hypothetical protein
MPTQEHADDFPETAEAWAGLIVVLAQDRDRAEADLAGIADQRRPLALRSATGDAKAQKEVNRLNTEDAATRAQIATLAEALADAETRRAAAAAQEAAARAEARRERLAEGVRALLGLAAEYDARAAAFARAGRDYDDALRDLAKLGLDSGALNKLRGTTMRTATLHFAGLGGVMPLPHVAPRHHQTLRDWTVRMIGHHVGEALPAAPLPAPAPEPEVAATLDEDHVFSAEELAEEDRQIERWNRE